MAEQKTRPTDASVRAYIDGITDESRRKDCEQLVALLGRVTMEKPVMWGKDIVGFGGYHHRYAGGHEGDSFLAGFSSRKGDISVYIMAGFGGREELLIDLGKHKRGKACLYIKRMADIDSVVLERLVALSVVDIRRRHA